jgi:hypothetical protein
MGFRGRGYSRLACFSCLHGRFSPHFFEVQAMGASTGRTQVFSIHVLSQGDEMMALTGILITLLGFLIALLSLSVTSDVYGRLAMVVAGVVVSLIGIIGVLNRSYMKNALWRK